MTAKRVAKVEQRMMVCQLDSPTPFTIKDVRWQDAKKSDFKNGPFALTCLFNAYPS